MPPSSPLGSLGRAELPQTQLLLTLSQPSPLPAPRALRMFSLTLPSPRSVCFSSRPLAESTATSPGAGWLLQVQLSKCHHQIPTSSLNWRNPGFVLLLQVPGIPQGSCVCPAPFLTFVRRRKDPLLETAYSLFRCPSGKFIRPDEADTRLCEAFRGKPGKRNWIGGITLKETGGILPINKRCQIAAFYYLTNGLL